MTLVSFTRVASATLLASDPELTSSAAFRSIGSGVVDDNAPRALLVVREIGLKVRHEKPGKGTFDVVIGTWRGFGVSRC
jgi:hypothetical protein